MNTVSSSKQLSTIISITCVAAFITVEGHELLGHGLAAYLCGAHSFSLFSTGIYFRIQGQPEDFSPSSVVGRWVAAAGALFNFVAGLILLALFSNAKNIKSTNRYFLWLLAAMNLFALPCYLAYSAISRTGDFQDVISGLPHESALRLIMAGTGIVSYLIMIRVVAAGLVLFTDNLWKLTLIPYLVTITVFCTSASLSSTHKRDLLISASIGNAIVFIGLLAAVPYAKQLGRKVVSTINTVEANTKWICCGICAVLALLRIGSGISWRL